MNDLLVKQIGGGAGCKDTKEEEDNEVFFVCYKCPILNLVLDVLFLALDMIVQLPAFNIIPNCTVPQD